MKTKTIIGILLLSAALTAYLFIWQEPHSIPVANTGRGTEKVGASPDFPSQQFSASPSQSNQDLADFHSVLSTQMKALLATRYVLTDEERAKLLKKKHGMALMTTTEEKMAMSEATVEFYGQVLDQFDHPVGGAKIRCSWPYMGPQDVARELQSASDGRFEVLGLKVPSIHVSVYPPPGYDEQLSDSRDIQFAKVPDRILQNKDYKVMTPEQKELFGQMHGFGEPHKPDQAKPVIFRLKKL